VIRIYAQAYDVAKDLAAEWEDGAALSWRRARFAVADGAAAAVAARSWAADLTSGYLTDFPEAPWADGDIPAYEGDVRQWFADRARRWTAAQERIIATRGEAVPWYHRDAAARGSAAAFLGVQLDCRGSRAVWWATAIGDCCLFQVRAGRLVTSFPLSSAAEYGGHPDLALTAGARLDGALRALRHGRGAAEPGDLFVLASDAAGEWLLTEAAHDPAVWSRLRVFGRDAFTELIRELRVAGAIRRDDVVLVLLRVANGDGPDAAGPS